LVQGAIQSQNRDARNHDGTGNARLREAIAGSEDLAKIATFAWWPDQVCGA
jgi:hypothetical protein